MKRFQFPLERVRRWRSEQATIEELKLGQLGERLAMLKAEKLRLEMECAETRRAVLGQASIEAYEVQSLEVYRRHAAHLVRNMEERRRECEAQIVEQRKRVIEARQKAELLLKLKQTAMEEWRVAANREEENLAAELYLAKRVRR
jgi:hypothetical protein